MTSDVGWWWWLCNYIVHGQGVSTRHHPGHSAPGGCAINYRHTFRQSRPQKAAEGHANVLSWLLLLCLGLINIKFHAPLTSAQVRRRRKGQTHWKREGHAILQPIPLIYIRGPDEGCLVLKNYARKYRFYSPWDDYMLWTWELMSSILEFYIFLHLIQFLGTQ